MSRSAIPLAVPIVGYLLQLYGFEWDVVWHVHERRESFWTAPHVLVYLGVELALLSGLLPIIWKRGRADAGAYLLAGAAGLQVIMAPIDDLWHRLYGLDNTLWSFPHLVFIEAGAASVLALVVLSRRPSRPELDGWRGALRDPALPLFGLFLCALDIGLLEFELNLPAPYWPWDYGLYPPLMIAAALLAGFAAYSFTGRFGAITLACAAYTLLQVGINLELLALGYRALPVVPPLLPGALAADLALRFIPGRLPLRAVLAGVLFGVIFSGLLWPYNALVTPPRWPFVAGPWRPDTLAAGWPLACLLAPTAAVLGLALGRALPGGWRATASVERRRAALESIA
jgi:hypothetical protein